MVRVFVSFFSHLRPPLPSYSGRIARPITGFQSDVGELVILNAVQGVRIDAERWSEHRHLVLKNWAGRAR
jgi:hypothetical protein